MRLAAKSISLGGLYLQTNERDGLEIGTPVQLAIPNRKKGNIIQRYARVIWSNRDGVGVEFQRMVKKIWKSPRKDE